MPLKAEVCVLENIIPGSLWYLSARFLAKIQKICALSARFLVNSDASSLLTLHPALCLGLW